MQQGVKEFQNPFRPGAGHMPPYLAGRETEQEEFRRLLQQDVILENLVLTGLRGVGKTVLLETFKPIALDAGWVWIGTDLSESTSISEKNLAIRLLADLSVFTSSIEMQASEANPIGFIQGKSTAHRLDFTTLSLIYDATPGLPADKLKAVLELAALHIQNSARRGIIFAYDEAQNLSDHAAKNEYPLSLLLDVFQSLQRKGITFMLVLTGLPTLFPKLVEARTYAERMFHVVFLKQLDEQASREAITQPIKKLKCPVSFKPMDVDTIVQMSRGYPYFIQFICREIYDVWLQRLKDGQLMQVPKDAIMRKLDSDFFSGRWARATDRQRELLEVIAQLENCDGEFTVQEIVTQSRSTLEKPFSSSHVNQMLASLTESGLIYKNRYGKYSLAVPLLADFIRRQYGVTLSAANAPS